MLALGAHWRDLADDFYGEQTCVPAADRGVEGQIHQKMGLKFNFRRIPLQWRLLIGVQLALSGCIMVYRQRVLAVKAKQQE